MAAMAGKQRLVCFLPAKYTAHCRKWLNQRCQRPWKGGKFSSAAETLWNLQWWSIVNMQCGKFGDSEAIYMWNKIAGTLPENFADPPCWAIKCRPAIKSRWDLEYLCTASFHGEIRVFLNLVEVTWCYRHGNHNVNGFMTFTNTIFRYRWTE